MGIDPKDVDVTVVGGHAGITILPLFSRVNGAKFTDAELEAITVRTRELFCVVTTYAWRFRFCGVECGSTMIALCYSNFDQ